MRREFFLPLSVVFLSLVTLLVYLVPFFGQLRGLIVLLFVFLVPGLALVPLLGLEDIAANLSFSIGLSISLATLISLIFIYSGALIVDGILLLLMASSFVGALCQLYLANRVTKNHLRTQKETLSLVKKAFFSWKNTQYKHLLTNALSLVGTTAVTSGLGFVYWWVAARLFSQTEVGFSSACISAMQLLGSIGMLGLGTLLIGELPRQRDKAAALISTSLLVAALSGFGLGLIFSVLLSYVSDELKPLSGSPGSLILFATGVSLTSITMVLDQALIGLLRGGTQLWRNILFSVVKLGLLWPVAFLIADKTGLEIYTTWLLGNLLSLVLLALMVIWKGGRLRAFKPQLGLLHGLSRQAISHHLLNLALQAPGLTLPVVVTIALSAETNASFYVAWMIASFVFVAPTALTTVLYAVTAADKEAVVHKLRFSLRTGFFISLVATLVLLVCADFILNLFGHNYTTQASWALRIMGLGAFPLLIKVHYVTLYRIYDRVRQVIVPVAAGGILSVALAAMGASLYSLTGLSAGWLVGEIIQAALMAPLVIKEAILKDKSRREATQLPVFKVKLLVDGETVALPKAPAGVPKVIEFELHPKNKTLTLGRNRNNDLVLPFLSVSRYHLELSFGSEGLWIKDLNSANGTSINQLQLQPNQPQLLQSGDCLIVGKVNFGVEIVSPDYKTGLQQVEKTLTVPPFQRILKKVSSGRQF